MVLRNGQHMAKLRSALNLRAKRGGAKRKRNLPYASESCISPGTNSEPEEVSVGEANRTRKPVFDFETRIVHNDREAVVHSVRSRRLEVMARRKTNCFVVFCPDFRVKPASESPESPQNTHDAF